MEKPIKIVKLKVPHKDLSPNARVHWATKAKHTKKERFLSCLCFQHAFKSEHYNPNFEPFKEAIIKRVFYFSVNRRRDKDNFNAMTKAVTDGMVDSGILIDDNKITWLPTEFIIDDNQRLEYEVYSLKY